MRTPTAWGDAFSVPTTWNGDQVGTQVLGLSNGQFIVTWTANTGLYGGDHVRAGLFDALAQPLGSDFRVSTPDIRAGEGVIAETADGQIALAWSEHSEAGGDGDKSGIRARIIDFDGNEVGNDFLVNTTTPGFQYADAIAAQKDGRFVVTWSDPSRSTDGNQDTPLVGQMFDSGGNRVGTEFRISPVRFDSNGVSDIAALQGGGFVVVWTRYETPGETWARLLDDDGRPAGPAFKVAGSAIGFNFKPSVEALAGGGFVVSGIDYADDSNYPNIRFGVFDNLGQKIGDDILVETGTAYASGFYATTALPDGKFVVTWTDTRWMQADEYVNAVRAQVYEADGSPSGDPFLVATAAPKWPGATASIFQTDVSALADGRFVMLWETMTMNSSQQVLDVEIDGQIFDARTQAIRLDGTPLADTYVGTRFNDDIAGARGDDRLFGAAGQDDLFGGQGRDMLAGQTGGDRLFGGSGADVLSGGYGDDLLFGNRGDDILKGGAGRDLLAGGRGDDVLRGRKGDDFLKGGAGDDTLFGGQGQDRMTGGGGRDTFVFTTIDQIGRGPDSDVITDFTSGVDSIDLQRIAPDQRYVADAAFSMTSGELRYDAAVGRLEGDIDGDGIADFQLVLSTGVALTADDLLL